MPFPRYSLFFVLIVCAYACVPSTCTGQDLRPKEIRILEKFDIQAIEYDLSDTQTFENLSEIARLERSRRAALSIGVGLSALSILPIGLGVIANANSSGSFNDPLGNALIVAGVVHFSLSVPFYIGARSVKKRRDKSIARLKLRQP